MSRKAIALLAILAGLFGSPLARADVIGECGIPRVLRSALPFLRCPPSTSLEPVLLEMASRHGIVRLKIPRAYVESAASPNGNSGGTVHLNAFLPDMLPFVLAAQAGHKVHGRVINGIEMRSEDEITINLKPYGGIDQKQRAWIKRDLLQGPSFANLFETYFYKYQGSANQISGYFLPLSDEMTIIKFSRNPNTSELLGCTLEYSLDDNIWVDAIFNGKYLFEYKMIKQKVSDLLNSFVVK